jgi:predicted fused transcriptional regulator/phosphomethylpyrimidine kinase
LPERKDILITVRRIKVRLMNDFIRERNDTLETLREAAGLLMRSLDVRLIPVHGAKLGFAVTGARDKNGVAAVKGGIVTEQERPHAAGPCDFGVDEEIARIILTAMKFDPAIRSAATLRCTGNMHSVVESLLFEFRSFEPAREPPGISTMDWGVASCCREGVPDVCYRKEKQGNESGIFLFGEDPVDVANNIIMISNRIIHIEL